MLQIAVCDDNSDFLEREAELIELWAAQSKLPIELHSFDNGDALISKITAVRMDIVFLDIIMPLQSGMDIAKELRQRDNAVKIVFLTSSPEFALESYDVKASGYLLKPVTYEKSKGILDECSRSFDAEPQNAVLKTTFGYQKIFFHDIEYLEAQNKKVAFHLRTGKTILATEPLYLLESRFTESEGFFKCHRSYLVYLPNVDHFNQTEIITKSGQTVPIARGYGKAFQETYFSAMFKD